MNTAGILVVEDDEAIASGLERVLDSQGYAVRRLARGRPAVTAADDEVALAILDLGPPDVDGIDVCRRLRAARPDLAILIVTARDHELDVVAGLDAGADDYLVKPFRLSELLARIRARCSSDPRESMVLRAVRVRAARRQEEGGGHGDGYGQQAHGRDARRRTSASGPTKVNAGSESPASFVAVR